MNRDKIAFLVDSCADLTEEVRAGKPFYLVPLRITCEDGDFRDGVDIWGEDVCRRLEAGELPRTSLPDPMSVTEALERIRADGYERVIALPLSSGLSGTHNMIRIQCEEFEGLECVVADTRSGSMGIGIVALQLWEDVQAGMGWEELTKKRVPFLLKNTFPFFSVDTLEYLQKGGRIGKVTAMAGSLLNIKPILTFAPDGELVSVAKVRGKKQVNAKFIELLKEHFVEGKRFNLAVANGGAEEDMAKLKADVQAAFPGCEHIWEGPLDATLSVYLGRGMLGTAIQMLE